MGFTMVMFPLGTEDCRLLLTEEYPLYVIPAASPKFNLKLLHRYRKSLECNRYTWTFRMQSFDHLAVLPMADVWRREKSVVWLYFRPVYQSLSDICPAYGVICRPFIIIDWRGCGRARTYSLLGCFFFFDYTVWLWLGEVFTVILLWTRGIG